MSFKTVLLVDDSADDILLTKRALSRLNDPPEVQSIVDPVEAHRQLTEEEMPLPNLLLLDIRMPRINGLELLEKLRAHPRTEKLCMVMLTSSDETPDIALAKKLGANSYLVKPVDPHAYLEIVKRFGNAWSQNGSCPDFWPNENRRQ